MRRGCARVGVGGRGGVKIILNQLRICTKLYLILIDFFCELQLFAFNLPTHSRTHTHRHTHTRARAVDCELDSLRLAASQLLHGNLMRGSVAAAAGVCVCVRCATVCVCVYFAIIRLFDLLKKYARILILFAF